LPKLKDALGLWKAHFQFWTFYSMCKTLRKKVFKWWKKTLLWFAISHSICLVYQIGQPNELTIGILGKRNFQKFNIMSFPQTLNLSHEEPKRDLTLNISSLFISMLNSIWININIMDMKMHVLILFFNIHVGGYRKEMR
jgi:hypothetical protein